MSKLLKVRNKKTGIVRYITQRAFELQPKGTYQLIEGKVKEEKTEKKPQAAENVADAGPGPKTDDEFENFDEVEEVEEVEHTELEKEYHKVFGTFPPKHWKDSTVEKKIKAENK